MARDGRERIGNGADIKNIGVNARDVPVLWPSVTGGSLEIVITSWDLMSNAALNEWDIELDADNDGVGDQVIVLADSGLVTTGYANGVFGCFFVDNLGWGGTPGYVFDLNGTDCMAYADPVTSVVYLSLEQTWFWETDATGGAKFRVTSYNGAGWDSDSTGSSWMFVSYDELAGAGQYVSDVIVPNLATGGSIPEGLPTLGHPSVDGTTPSLGWLFWNEYNAGASSEVYEVLIP